MADPLPAPRFRAYLDRTYGALIMLRSEWERLATYEDQPVVIDVSDTPMSAISGSAELVATFAERTAEGKATITIVRLDPKDSPNDINLDKFEVWENIYQHIDVQTTITAASTNGDPPLLGFLQDYVFIVPLGKGPDHHVAELPGQYSAVLKGSRAGA